MYRSTLSLVLAQDGMCGQRHNPPILCPAERTYIHCTWGWADPRASLEVCGKLRCHQNSIPGPFST